MKSLIKNTIYFSLLIKYKQNLNIVFLIKKKKNIILHLDYILYKVSFNNNRHFNFFLQSLLNRNKKICILHKKKRFT